MPPETYEGLQQLVDASVRNTRASLWPWFGPEVILCATIMLLLLARLFRVGRWFGSFPIALLGCLAALLCIMAYGSNQPGELFTGMLVQDGLSVFIRALLIVFAILFVVLTRLSGQPNREDAADFYSLVLGGLIGMCLMATANHLLIVFLAVEMASVPSYALAASLKGRRLSSEAGLKYAIYGAGAAGVMLYGISLLAGLVGSAHLPTIASRLATDVPAMSGSHLMVLALAGLMIFVGLAFKLSAFPFHFWCPDVFEGTSAEVAAFLSVASKAAALALLLRMTLGVGCETTRSLDPPVAERQLAAARSSDGSLFSLADESEVPAGGAGAADAAANSGSASSTDGLKEVRAFMALVIAFIAAITCTFGNLAAYGQTNIKRLMAYSTIAHAGYMMLPVPAVLALYGVDHAAAARGVASLGIYLSIYLFMNLGAFAIIAFLRNEIGSEEIADYAGLVHRAPGLVVCMGVILFSLVGLPPLAGFVGKFAIFAALTEGYQRTGEMYLLILLIVGAINTAVSLFYYLRVIKVMAIDPEPDRERPWNWSMISLQGTYLLVVTIPLLLLFLKWSALNDQATAAALQLFS